MSLTGLLLAIGITLCVYGVSWWAMRHGLAWFIVDTRNRLPRRRDRAVVLAVILSWAPYLALAALVIRARDAVRHARAQRIIALLPRQTDPEQQHVVDELKNERFYDRVHHPAGDLGSST